MLRVTISQAEPGMVLAMPVFHPRHPRVMLLRPGAELDTPCIDRLREMLVGELWIDYPRFEAIRRFVSPELVVSCREMTARVARVLDGAAALPETRLDYHAYRQSTSLVLESLSSSPSAALFIMEMAENLAPPLRHACNVCFLSLLMGLKLEGYLNAQRAGAPGPARLAALGVGAMLHDVGMLELDLPTLDRWRRTFDESDPAWRAHARLGYDIVRRELEPSAAAVVLHHHQAYDGSGFPASDGEARPRAGSDIHVFARIAAVADMFDRLRHPGHEGMASIPGRPAMPTVRALKTMLSPALRPTFDPCVLRALLEVTPAYAPGSIVTLADGRGRTMRAVVTDWSADDPCRPGVELIAEARRAADHPGECVDLSRRPDLSIVEVDGFDVRNDNFEPVFERGALVELTGAACSMPRDPRLTRELAAG